MMLIIIACLAVLLLALLAAFWFFADGDLTLMLIERFGRKAGKCIFPFVVCSIFSLHPQRDFFLAVTNFGDSLAFLTFVVYNASVMLGSLVYIGAIIKNLHEDDDERRRRIAICQTPSHMNQIIIIRSHGRQCNFAEAW